MSKKSSRVAYVAPTSAKTKIIDVNYNAGWGGPYIGTKSNDFFKLSGSGIDYTAAGPTIDGKGGADQLFFHEAATVTDTFFTNLTSIEVLKLANGSGMSVDLGTEALEAGIKDVTGGDGLDEIEFLSAYSSTSVKVNGGDGDDSITCNGGDDKITGGMGADQLTGGSGTDNFRYVVISDSAASIAANTTVTFDSITDFVSGTDKIDIRSINSALTGGSVATSVNINTTITPTAMDIIDDFAELKAYVDSLPLTASVSSGAIQAYVIDLSSNTGGLGTGKYLLVNDNDTVLDTGDLMIELTGTSNSPSSGDFLF